MSAVRVPSFASGDAEREGLARRPSPNRGALCRGEGLEPLVEGVTDKLACLGARGRAGDHARQFLDGRANPTLLVRLEDHVQLHGS